jgi:hypothetical protein
MVATLDPALMEPATATIPCAHIVAFQQATAAAREDKEA